MTDSLATALSADAYDGYVYSYPHKLAYRRLDPPVPLSEAWRDEDKSRLFLYVHLPFCEMRCGFCNLFTTTRPGAGLVDQTLAAMTRQSDVVASAIEPDRVTQAAFGGGTPTFLSTAEIVRLFEGLQASWPVDWAEVPVSFESSPGTVDPDKLRVLKQLGVDRLSIGVQSFVRDEVKSIGRPQDPAKLAAALSAIQHTGFEVFNLDLIYGAQGQTPRSWLRSLREAVTWAPDELYLYPLYVRPLTGLGRTDRSPGENRRELYRLGRDFLLSEGYRQVSMRLFRKVDAPASVAEYTCQEDGMVGLGAGARSYTGALHYSSEYAVGMQGTKRIIEAFNARDDDAYRVADYGVRLDLHEQKRRWVLKSLLRDQGLDLAGYEARFGRPARLDLPQLDQLTPLGLASEDQQVLRLSAAGLERSDTIGPWLYSTAVKQQMAPGSRE